MHIFAHFCCIGLSDSPSHSLICKSHLYIHVISHVVVDLLCVFIACLPTERISVSFEEQNLEILKSDFLNFAFFVECFLSVIV